MSHIRKTFKKGDLDVTLDVTYYPAKRMIHYTIYVKNTGKTSHRWTIGYYRRDWTGKRRFWRILEKTYKPSHTESHGRNLYIRVHRGKYYRTLIGKEVVWIQGEPEPYSEVWIVVKDTYSGSDLFSYRLYPLPEELLTEKKVTEKKVKKEVIKPKPEAKPVVPAPAVTPEVKPVVAPKPVIAPAPAKPVTPEEKPKIPKELLLAGLGGLAVLVVLIILLRR